MRVFYTTSDNGDGSSSVRFFKDQKNIARLEEEDPETYAMGEGGSWFDVTDESCLSNIEYSDDEEVEG